MQVYSAEPLDIIHHGATEQILFRAATLTARLGYKNTKAILQTVGQRYTLNIPTNGGKQDVSYIDATQAALVICKSKTIPVETKRDLLTELYEIINERRYHLHL